MTLTCDHRAVDGATGAEFLATVKAFLEEPGLRACDDRSGTTSATSTRRAPFYTEKLGFTETFVDPTSAGRSSSAAGWRSASPRASRTGGRASRTSTSRTSRRRRSELRRDGVEVGVVLELHGEIRLLDVFDPDGNRIQFAQEL